MYFFETAETGLFFEFRGVAGLSVRVDGAFGEVVSAAAGDAEDAPTKPRRCVSSREGLGVDWSSRKLKELVPGRSNLQFLSAGVIHRIQFSHLLYSCLHMTLQSHRRNVLARVMCLDK